LSRALAANVAGMKNEVKQPKTAAISCGSASGIYIPRFGRLVILRFRRIAFAERHSPGDDQHRKHEQKCRAGHFFEHCPVPLIFIRIAEDSLPVSLSLIIG
jgi:hypothetical protein